MTDEDHRHVAAVILNWNGAGHTITCLRSLTGSDWRPLTPIVVDNGSDEDLGTALHEAGLGEVELIRNSKNMGFAGGMNTGMRRALELDADYVLLLNNDTVVDPRMVRLLVRAATKQPMLGMMSPLELFRDAPDIVAGAGRRCNLRRAYQGPPLNLGERVSGKFQGVREVDVSTGTAMLVPSDVIRDVGFLDEALFLYIEDVDWSLRIREMGLGIYVCLDARLWHGVAKSSGGEDSPEVAYYHARNSFVVVNRHEPMNGPRAVLRHLELLAVNLLHALKCRQPMRNVRAVIDGWRDFRRGRLGPRTRGGVVTGP